MTDKHDPRNWFWPLGTPETLKDLNGTKHQITSKMPDKRDTRDPEELGKEILKQLVKTEGKMAVKTLNIRRNADGTITIRANNYIESIEIAGKTDIELFEAVRYAIICANFEWDDETEALVRSELDK